MAATIKDSNYVTIQGWMLTRLKLKPLEALIFATIYGFCQDGESEFKGSRSYLAAWCNVSLPTIDKALDALLSKGVIIKRTIIENKQTYNRYTVPEGVVNFLYGGSKETLGGYKEPLQGGSKETLYHNNNIHITKDNNNNNNKEEMEKAAEILSYDWLDK